MVKMVVLETNEIPLSVHRWYASKAPHSAIAAMLRSGYVGETINCDDLGDRELYPSQTWATLATGVSHQEHGIYWYADDKPADYPLYWEIAARDRTVGVIGCLHSSPLDRLQSLPGLRFCMPDVFAPDPAARPDALRPLQAFTISMTSRNSRAVRGVSSPRLALKGVHAMLRARLSARGVARVGRLVWDRLVRSTPPERLRTAHFEISADVFLRQMRTHDPDLAVFFTNHVAAAMHRYWYAAFPEQSDEAHFDDAWCARYGDEIRHAMDALDVFVRRVSQHCEQTDRRLVLLSSMGQTAARSNAEQRTHAFVVDDVRSFLDAVGVPGDWKPREGMAPQASAAFETNMQCSNALDLLEREWGTESGLTFEATGRVLTITYRPTIDSTGKVGFGDRIFTAAELGGTLLDVDDSRNGEHHPRGAFLVPDASGSIPDLVDARDVAPAILAALDLEPAEHHRTPEFTL